MYLPHPKGTAQICQPLAGGGRQLGCVKEIALGREGVGGMGGGAWLPARLPGAAGREEDALQGYIWRPQAVTLSAEPWGLGTN